MVLPKTVMYTGADKPKLRAVMLQNVAGLHYIYITAEKPQANSSHLPVTPMTGILRLIFLFSRLTANFHKFYQLIITFVNYL